MDSTPLNLISNLASDINILLYWFVCLFDCFFYIFIIHYWTLHVLGSLWFKCVNAPCSKRTGYLHLIMFLLVLISFSLSMVPQTHRCSYIWFYFLALTLAANTTTSVKYRNFHLCLFIVLCRSRKVIFTIQYSAVTAGNLT